MALQADATPAAFARGGPDLAGLRDRIDRRFRQRRRVALALPLLLLAYLAYVALAFDLPGLVQKARIDNALILLSDSYSHKTHVTRDNRSGAISIAIEGERKGLYPQDAPPEWVRRQGDSTLVDLPKGAWVSIAPQEVVMTLPGRGTARLVPGPGGVALTLSPGFPPDLLNASDNRVVIAAPEGRLTVTRARTEVFRYHFGWELFFFTLDSPFHGKSLAELARLALGGPELRPGHSNIAAMAQDIWTNAMWRHADVAWALFETLLMAFLGTLSAALIGLPLAFLAARNFGPSRALRFGMRRVFDFLRGVDGLIWTIILARAFGPGPLTGALAIALTDTGSFGKLFSEALENVDDRQVEGLRATGANGLQRNRFGVLPQVAPVILSQVLYFLESNTRSATVIGAIVGGGIGLMLTQAIQTQKDWEEVSYYIVLIVLLVMAMDWLSGRIRRRLIRGA